MEEGIYKYQNNETYFVVTGNSDIAIIYVAQKIKNKFELLSYPPFVQKGPLKNILLKELNKCFNRNNFGNLEKVAELSDILAVAS